MAEHETVFEITDEMAVQAGKALGAHALCISCLGRLFGKLGKGYTNAERGRDLLEHLHKSDDKLEDIKKCWLCAGLLGDLDRYADIAGSEMKQWDHSTFLVGTKIEPEIQVREEDLWVEAGVQHPEALKSELNREIGKLLEKKTGKKADFKYPDIVAIIDTRYDFVTLQIASIYIRGRYRKHVRDIPQTRWPCYRCMGKGCEHCGGKGKMYATSVEELAAAEVMKDTLGQEHAFHGMGREDIDARMLGNGRPFILEIKTPRKRALDISGLEKRINESAGGRIEVMGLLPARPDEVETLKNTAVPKTYSVEVRITGWPGDMGKLKKAVSVFPKTRINQQTPARVSHRRADLVRKREIITFELDAYDPASGNAAFTITAESGTYIKELVTGDGGRTKPSVSEILGADCAVTKLDVIRIHDEK